jgi:hypothetical protein
MENPQWQGKLIVSRLAEYAEIRQSGELELKPDPEARHCIPAVIMAKMNAFS